ncbi:MAG: membrane dipeptidase [Chloroflexota bacterium]
MTPFSRRDFLKLSLLGLGLAACRGSRPAPTAQPTTTAPTQAPAAPIHTLASPTLSPSSSAALSPTSTPQPSATAAPRPFPSFVIDGHQDIAWNALEFERDPRQSAYETRQREAANGLDEMIGQCTCGLPEYLSGRVGLIFATLFVMPAEYAYPGRTAMTYRTPEQAQQRAQAQVDFYRQLTAGEPRLRLVTTLGDLEAVVAGWTEPKEGQQPQVGIVLNMEGADPLLSPDDLPAWHARGLRSLGPAWRRTRYSGGTGEPGPLTALGKKLLPALAELNMILDLSHLAEAAYLEAVDSYAGPLIASHSNPRRFLPSDRGLSDEMVRKLVARDGVIGLVLWNRYLDPAWRPNSPPGLVTLETVADAVDYVAQIAGDARHVAIGTDFDGAFGAEAIPEEMDSAADLIKLAETLTGRGYTQEDIEGVLNGNWLRVLRRSLPAT